ncbi:flavodoxin [Tannerella sp. oral taxon BU063 isolate Cell 6/7/9]|uniref:Flavodoxin n=1 Tax=Tannerella sp. oral taxon BU063 isolate Cell 6/7/9 TaxID=1411021 RepID=W2CK43_9BACT|nr:flavodoxin [Tannerella sp. oral taxon BU063 isolate Cell 6/7/9]
MKAVAKDIYYVGVNDRQKALFENLWPLPGGVSYNSYLIVDDKTVLVDTVDICYSDLFFKRVAKLLNGRKLDYLVVDHMEPDHAGSIRLLRQIYPDVKIIGNKQTFGMLAGYHGITDGLHEVKEGDTLDLGHHKLSFYMAPMVHWPEVMVTYEETEKVLFSADAFGTFGTLDGGVLDTDMDTDRFWSEMTRYYANIVGKYGGPVQRALKKLSGLDIQTICSTHGPVWTRQSGDVIALYDRLSRYEGLDGVTIVYGSMYGHTEQMAEDIATALSDGGVRHIAMHNVSKSHGSYILRDVFNYRGLIVGCPTYSGQLYPEVEMVLSEIKLREVKDRLFSYFGSFTWAGAAVKHLAAYAEAMKWEVVGTPVDQKQGISTEEQCIALGQAMAERLRGTNK